MRIHSDILTEADLYEAAKAADMTFETFGVGGSRSKAHAFTVLASGNSTRNAMSNDFKAATWDQWGVFLGILFDKDFDMHTGKNGYSNGSDFAYKTQGRFDSVNREEIDVKSSHCHRWDFDYPFAFSCKTKTCDAEMRTR